ncbi:MAG: Crp/Fnr family transcriptional regulator [Leptolyngbyaceae cyanobacterium bins.59]|nr:Crp/Fnr family transcriptional regulator [Leptolyngbyaceae cyanobacterium bins.59]
MSATVPISPLPFVATESRRFGRRTSLPAKTSCLWRIERGVVRTISWLEDATTVTLGLWGPGDVIGKPLSKIDPYQFECITEVEAIVLPREHWSQLTEALILYAQRLEELSIIRSHKRVEEALIHLLNWLGQRFGQEVVQGHLLDLRLTHQDLADLLGTTRVTITRILNQLEQQGTIRRLSRQQILLQGECWHYEI